MNAKKHSKVAKLKRRMPKITLKHEKKEKKDRRVNIGAKRLTLLPGFLINGFTSGTTRKGSSVEIKQAKEVILSENLQTFLERKGTLRRSQRIFKKQNYENSAVGSSSKSTVVNFAEDTHYPAQNDIMQPNFLAENLNFKSILKNNSKSIFKEINDKFCRISIEKNNMDNPTEFIEGNECLMYPNKANSQEDCRKVIQPDTWDFSLKYNKSFCRDFIGMLKAQFKSTAIKECQEKIKSEINMTNMILAGGATRPDEHILDDNYYESEETTDKLLFAPVPCQNWVYYTPKNQKVPAPVLDECQLKPAMLCTNKNQQDLFDFNENMPQAQEKFHFQQIAALKRTPAFFGTKVYKNVDHKVEYSDDIFQKPTWSGVTNKLDTYNPQHPAILRPNPISQSLKRSMPSLASYLENEIPCYSVPVTPGENIFNPDFTFIEDGNNFKLLQESQPDNSNRPTSQKKQFIAKKTRFSLDLGGAEEPKLFNFASQDCMFNFNV